MRAVAIISVLAFALAAGACAGSQQAEFTKADREAIQKANADLVAAFNAKDVDSIIPLYSAESQFMPPNYPSMRGHDSVRSFYKELLDEGASTLQMDSQEITGHGPIAMQSGTYSLQVNGKGKTLRDRGKYVRVLRNTAGTWRIEKTIWSSDLPQPTVVAAD
jgi:ketosteroid isomerase-like protein